VCQYRPAEEQEAYENVCRAVPSLAWRTHAPPMDRRRGMARGALLPDRDARTTRSRVVPEDASSCEAPYRERDVSSRQRVSLHTFLSVRALRRSPPYPWTAGEPAPSPSLLTDPPEHGARGQHKKDTPC
jgi:hypothetical protein